MWVSDLEPPVTNASQRKRPIFDCWKDGQLKWIEISVKIFGDEFGSVSKLSLTSQSQVIRHPLQHSKHDCLRLAWQMLDVQGHQKQE